MEAINDAAHILSVTDSVLDRLEELEQTDFIDKGGKEVVPERFDVALSMCPSATAARGAPRCILYRPPGDHYRHRWPLRLRKEYHLQFGCPVL